MRLFHYKLIPYLDNKHLVASWRELVAIKRQWEKGTLKHRLVSYVMSYDRELFWNYVFEIVEELKIRNIKYQEKYFDEIYDFCNEDIKKYYTYGYYPEHNDIYLRECLYNLEEKAMRGIISKEEWQVIYDEFKDFTELWKGK